MAWVVVVVMVGSGGGAKDLLSEGGSVTARHESGYVLVPEVAVVKGISSGDAATWHELQHFL